MKNQKGFIQILLIGAVVVALAVAGYWFYSQKFGSRTGMGSLGSNYLLQTQNQPASDQVAPVQNAGDLNKVSASLDAQDTTQIDSQLNQLNSASSGF